MAERSVERENFEGQGRVACGPADRLSVRCGRQKRTAVLVMRILQKLPVAIKQAFAALRKGIAFLCKALLVRTGAGSVVLDAVIEDLRDLNQHTESDFL